jgi:cytochrome b561
MKVYFSLLAWSTFACAIAITLVAEQSKDYDVSEDSNSLHIGATAGIGVLALLFTYLLWRVEARALLLRQGVDEIYEIQQSTSYCWHSEDR